MTRPARPSPDRRTIPDGPGKPYTWRLEPFEYAPEGDKFLLFIEGAYHGFGGIAGPIRFPGSGPDNADHVEYVRVGSLAFWNAYLEEDEAARGLLGSEAFSEASEGKAEVTAK